MNRVAVALLALFAVIFVTVPARAQLFDISSNVDATEVELGDTVTYTMQANSQSADSPSDAKLTSHAGFTIVTSSVFPTHMVSIVNGRRSEKHGLTGTWVLRSDRLGTFTIGPASVMIGAQRRSAPAQRVTVVAPGKGTTKKKPPTSPFDPFGGSGGTWDPFKNLIPGMDDDDRGSDLFGAQSADPKYALDSPRAPVAFLHATVDKTRAVVGEQVTLTVYLYEDPHVRQGHPSDVHEATATDFVKRSLLQDETRAIGLGTAMVGGRPWMVKLVRKNALFPLKTGRLSILPMSLTLPQNRVGLRESETLVVDVSEPPVNGRPPGYQVGDVGDFSLSATVSPRNIDQHGALGVTVELRGTGNLPAQLPTPIIPGVEWLDPTTKDALGATQNDRFGGTRTFTYVVRVHKDGAVDLGEVKVPFWDPSSRRYNVARASLGIVTVAKNAARDAGADEQEQVLPNLPVARNKLEGIASESYLTERAWYWGALFGTPLAGVLLVSAGAGIRRLRERRAAAAPSPEKIARERHAEAEAAVRGSDGKAAMSAIARAVEAAVLAKTTINVKGTSREAALEELTGADVEENVAREVLDVLRACEDARFSPDGVSSESARDLWSKAKTTLDRIKSGEKAA